MDAPIRHERERVIGIRQLQEYLRRHGYPDALLTAVSPLGEQPESSVKSYGYGRPLRISFTSRGVPHEVVIRTMRPDPFGHDRRSDRFATLMLAHDSFDAIPGHVRALDLGAFDEAGNLISLPRGEPFLVTEYVPGTLYAKDLRELAPARRARPVDQARAERLAGYLAELHVESASERAYVRSIRDVLGSGEGIFGLADSYPRGHPVASAERLADLEVACVRWRWKLKDRTHRARRTHGDFHPFNLLFADGTELAVLDASRGVAGDPADDVTCLSINYLFFALTHGDRAFDGAMRELWRTFWGVYLDRTADHELLDVVAPFFAWRALVVASPVWYPGIPDAVRDVIFRFAERLLAGARFDPDHVEDLIA
ncbi:phosphotransferase [Myxococcota bacterium]|nr:phosphotransferase [Myxococcota bacterium]